ncbi:MATE family efflux transporter [Fuchsiella alkaliacetigena]|uniref:MATE family efflux transporter n=1 Tax=Fuchsiella alkaliacetigena TaxID=957042 RepID=UPI00200AEC71|nr:MATE family efflux transporter [Fuchsiella alkaliacetigena]MCK8824005.1 MATE family efflux transporter [Fuchsiella alkaliacetigena]
MESYLIEEEITTTRFLKNIIVLAGPAIIEMLLNTVLGLADTIMVGRGIGAAGLAAVNLANQIAFPIVFIFSAFNIGTTAIVSRYFGARCDSRAQRTASQSYMLNVIVGLFLTVLIFSTYEQLLSLFPAEAEVVKITMEYLEIIIFSQFFMLITISLSSSFRGAGDTTTPMLINGTINLLNILGNWLLIFGIGFFPEWGIRGAAIATTLSRIIGALVFTIIAARGNKKISLIYRWFKINFKQIKKIWRISWSAALEQLIMQSSMVILNYLTLKLGTIDYSAYNIIVRLESISFMPIFGISIATTTLVGQYLGAQDQQNALKSGNLSALLGIGLSFLLGILFILFPGFLAGIFINDPEVVSSTVLPLRLAGIQQIPIAVMIIYSGALRGAGDTLRVMWITIIRMWGLAIPITYFVVNYTDTALLGIFIGQNITFAVAALIFYLYFRTEKWARIEI